MKTRPLVNREQPIGLIQAQDWSAIRRNRESNADAQRPTVVGQRRERSLGGQLHDGPRNFGRKRLRTGGQSQPSGFGDGGKRAFQGLEAG